MTVTDAREVAETRVRSWRYAYQGLMPQQFLDGLRPERYAAGLRRALARDEPHRVHLVADARDEGVIGWASFGPYRPVEDLDSAPTGATDGNTARAPADNWGELYALYVRPEFIGRGVGRSLLNAACDELAAVGRSRARVWVLRDNVRARRFYARAGFAPDGAESVLKLADEPVIEVRYGRPLNPSPSPSPPPSP